MIVYSIILFVIAALMITVGALVYCGRTGLIHDYHQKRIKDKKAYGKAMGKALIGIAVPFIIAGTIAFYSTSALPTLVLILGLIISFIPLFIVQKKYNGGMF